MVDGVDANKFDSDLEDKRIMVVDEAAAKEAARVGAESTDGEMVEEAAAKESLAKKDESGATHGVAAAIGMFFVFWLGCAFPIALITLLGGELIWRSLGLGSYSGEFSTGGIVLFAAAIVFAVRWKRGKKNGVLLALAVVILSALFLVLLYFQGLDQVDANEKAAAEEKAKIAQTAKAANSANPAVNVSVGDAVTAGKYEITFVGFNKTHCIYPSDTSGRYSYWYADKGNDFIVMKLKFKNNSSKKVVPKEALSNSFMDLANDDSYNHLSTIHVNVYTDAGTYSDEDVSVGAGKWSSVYVCFQVKKSYTGTMEYRLRCSGNIYELRFAVS